MTEIQAVKSMAFNGGKCNGIACCDCPINTERIRLECPTCAYIAKSDYDRMKWLLRYITRNGIKFDEP